MKRRIAIWMYNHALKMEPLILLGLQKAVMDLAAAQVQQAIAEVEAAQQQHQANVRRIARSN